jgi:hypothetical protein
VSAARKADISLMPSQAWQPFTPRGVAAFAHASITRLVLVQLAVAGCVAMTCVWFIVSHWFPIISEAIRELPNTGMIRRGVVTNSLSFPTRLAENRALAVVIDLSNERELGRVSDLEVVIKRTQIAVCGMTGCASVPYPRDYIISLNREELEPWWGAWRSPLAALVAIAVIIKLLLGWWFLGMLTTPLVKFIAFYCDRRVTLPGSFRVSGAALLPGAMIMAAGVILYGLGAVDLLQFGLIYLLHLFCGIVFVVTAPFFLPRLGEKLTNPFASPAGSDDQASPGQNNPFSR